MLFKMGFRTIYWFLVLMFLNSCSLRSFSEGVTPSLYRASCKAESNDNVIHVINFGWHTGVLVSSNNISEQLKELIPEFRQYPLVEVGWGDEEFYMGSGYSIWSGIRAAFFSSSTVVHIVGYESLKSVHLERYEVAQLSLTLFGFDQLEKKILNSVSLNDQNEPTRLGDSLYGHGSFYKATGSFSIFHTCNSWTSEVLQITGCDIDSSTRASKLMKQLRPK